MDSNQTTIIDNLRDIYKLDLNQVLDNELNKENLIDYYSLIHEIIESLKRNLKKSTSVKTSQHLEKNSDKILQLCLNKLSISIGKNDQLVLDNANLDINYIDSKSDTVLINYIRLCSPHCSTRLSLALFKAYLVYFSKILVINKLNILNHASLNTILGLSNNFFKMHDSNGSDHTLDLKQINFLLNYFNLIATNNLKSIDFGNDSSNKQMLEFLVDSSLFMLHRMNDNNLLNKLCINTLTKLACINKLTRNLVLTKVHLKIKENLKNENIYQPQSESVNTNHIEQQQVVNYLNENKKRTESFVQDLDLNLLASLGDNIADSALESISNNEFINLLTKSEYWHLIQSCLAFTNSLSRKQALYLLKRSIDIALVNKLEMNSSYFDSFSMSNVTNQNTNLNGNSLKPIHLFQATWSIWNDFFLCIELLEETSVHVIKPALSKVNNIIEAIKSNQFHYSWLLVLINRAFLHESKFIVRWAVSTFLQFDFGSLSKRSENSITRAYLHTRINGFIFGPFMLIMQKVYLYNK